MVVSYLIKSGDFDMDFFHVFVDFESCRIICVKKINPFHKKFTSKFIKNIQEKWLPVFLLETRHYNLLREVFMKKDSQTLKEILYYYSFMSRSRGIFGPEIAILRINIYENKNRD